MDKAMHNLLLTLMWVCASPLDPAAQPELASFLYQPAYCRDDVFLCPPEPYAPQPGDIFLATDQELWSRCGHWLAGGHGFHHSGIMFRRSDGHMALLEAGPFNSLQIEALDPFVHMNKHVNGGDRVWIRRRCVPLTPEQSACLTAFAEAQVGKPFAVVRMLAQVTPFRSRGSVRNYFIGQPNGGCRHSYFCSELVTECCVAIGLFDPGTARPSSTYPRDLFYGKSFNCYLNKHLCLDDWYPPARWVPFAIGEPR
jgi:hypothetical protein